ncbi:MAG TPA: hypothetical protein VHG51_12865 [Longimicrobiaceae bacterium]|nr:hypothetical protein [Longimicrobiaceae bacterium]
MSDAIASRILRFRSQEDLSVALDPAVIAGAPFEPNLRLGALLWSTPEEGGEPRRIGTATACARITDPAFTPDARFDFHVCFDLPEGTVTATGGCTLISNDLPVPGIVLAACHLWVVEAPAGFSGGAAASLSVFNPRRLPGYDTGSWWTVKLYEGA